MRVEGLMRLSFLPAKQLHEARTRGLLTHLHKKLPQPWKKPSDSYLFISLVFFPHIKAILGVSPALIPSQGVRMFSPKHAHT